MRDADETFIFGSRFEIFRALLSGIPWLHKTINLDFGRNSFVSSRILFFALALTRQYMGGWKALKANNMYVFIIRFDTRNIVLYYCSLNSQRQI